MESTGNTAETRRPSAFSRQARKAETQRALIEAAAELFAERGIERTSLDEIAARVGLTIGAIYANFRNKEALIDAVMEAHSKVVVPQPLFDAALGIAERWAALGREVARLLPEFAPNDGLLAIEFDLYRQRRPDKAALERAQQRALLEAEGERIDAVAAQRGEHSPLRGAELLALLDSIGEGIMFGWLRDPEGHSPAAVAEFFAIIGRGLAASAVTAAADEPTPEV